jgi:anthranilate phosphoribosyltransferase
VNPARPGVQLLGVADPKLLAPVADTLLGLGVGRALVVHGSGLDEIALHGTTDAILILDGIATSLTISPEQAGFATAPLHELTGGGAEENAIRLRDLLSGGGGAAEVAAVSLNAAALLVTAGLVGDLREGAEVARGTLASGEPFRRLEALVELTNG